MLKILIILGMLAATALLLARWASRGAPPAVGAAAPGFVLSDAQGHQHGLADYRGHWLVLYFYPRDATPGCTAEACNLRDAYSELRRLEVGLLGVSLDDSASHAAFAKAHALQFPLLSDADGKVAGAYGSLWDFGLIRFAKRHTFLIDPRGDIARVYDDVSPSGHAEEILADLARFGVVAAPAKTNNET